MGVTDAKTAYAATFSTCHRLGDSYTPPIRFFIAAGSATTRRHAESSEHNETPCPCYVRPLEVGNDPARAASFVPVEANPHRAPRRRR